MVRSKKNGDWFSWKFYLIRRSWYLGFLMAVGTCSHDKLNSNVSHAFGVRKSNGKNSGAVLDIQFWAYSWTSFLLRCGFKLMPKVTLPIGYRIYEPGALFNRHQFDNPPKNHKHRPWSSQDRPGTRGLTWLGLTCYWFPNVVYNFRDVSPKCPILFFY